MADRQKDQSKKNNRERKPKRTKEESRVFIRRLIVGILIGIGLMYVVFVFITTNFMGDESYVTEVATRASSADTIKSTAFIVRDEALLDNVNDGTLVYSVYNGDKIVAKGPIATVYQNETDAINKQKIAEIDEKIAFLESLSDTNTSVNVGIDSVNSQLNDKLTNLIDFINKSNFSNMSKVQDELMSLIYRKQIITGEQGSFKSIINSLVDERKELEAQTTDPIGVIKSDYAGYFVSNLDGYENIFNVNKLESITYEDFKNIKKNDVENNKYAGKIIKGVNWYVVCPISKDDQTTIEHFSNEIYIRLPYAINEKIPAKIVTTNESSDQDKVILVLSCNYMNSSLAEIRNESVDILVSSFEGIKISKAALHDDYCERTVKNEDGTYTTNKEKTQGVYVEYGNELIFKPVYIIYAADDYVICSEEPSSDSAFDRNTVSLYDKVVVEGNELYDGKILD